MKTIRNNARKTMVSMLVIVVLLSNIFLPSDALAAISIQRTPGGLVITVSDGTIKGIYSGEDGSSITWTLTSAGALTVSGSGNLPRIWFDKNNNFIGSRIKSATIKSGITSLYNGAFYECSNLTKISLPTSVTSIGYAAFGDCSNLKSISIPSNVSYIGEYAFYSCTALQSITLPSSVTLVDTEAFANCTSLASAIVYGDIGTDAFNNCISLTSLSLNGMPQYIGDRAFAYCTSLNSVSIPETVAEVGLGAFAYCENLTTAVTSGNLGESAFDCCYALKNIQIGEWCSTIGRRCFADCYSIETVVLPEYLAEINDAAFQNCTSLASINLRGSIEYLGTHTFWGCSALQRVAIPSSINQINDCLFSNCSMLSSIELHDGITSIGAGAFGNCTSLTTIDIPYYCTTIGEQAFYGCTSLNSIVIPSGVQTIEAGTFFDCSALISINIPNSVDAIGDHAFSGCKNIKNVSLSEGLISIDSYAFASCEKIDHINLPNTLTSLEEGTFANCSSLRDITIPSRLSIIPTAAFYDCKSLRTASLNSSIQTIRDWAFAGCESLESITIPDSVDYIGKAAFCDCKALNSVILPASITALPEGLFIQCDNLQTVTAKGTINSIGKYAFSDCGKLSKLNGFSSASIVGDYAFANDTKLTSASFNNLEIVGEAAFAFCSGLDSITIGANVSSVGDMAFIGCSGLNAINVTTSNQHYYSDGKVLYTKDKKKLIACVSNSICYDVVIPDSVQEISKYAFYNCSSIQNVTLPSSITRIEDDMFYGCTGIREISIPQTVTYIGDYAFAKCSNLQSITLPSSIDHIGEGAFMGCSSLHDVDMNSCSVTVIPAYFLAGCINLHNFTIPDTISFIGEYAFSECTLCERLSIPSSVTEIADFAFKESKGIVSVVLPENVTSIGRCAFDNSKDLSSVSFKGDVYAIGAGAFENTPLTDVYYAGNAPGVIGDYAFRNTSNDLLFHYNDAGSGWDTPVWEGPDHKSYKTSTIISGTCGKTLTWELVTHSGVLTISGSGEMNNSETTESTPWYDYNSLIKSVVITEGVTSIGSNTFSNINSLNEVYIPSSVTKVGYAAFANSKNIAVVQTNGGLKAVSNCMFYNCDQITDIELSEGLTAIGDYAFYGCANLGTITIPSTVKIIGEGAFATNLSLETLRFQGKVTTIGQGAFFNCVALTSIYVLNGAPKTVNNYAFTACNKDLKVYGTTTTSWLKGFEGSAETSESSVISGTCGALAWSVNPLTKTLYINGNGSIPNYSIGDSPWYQYNMYIYNIEISSGVSAIGDYSLAELTNANYITIPNTVTSIGKYAFAACSSLNQVQLPGSLVDIGEGVFSACVSLQEVALPVQITSIPNHAFSECLLLRNINAQSAITHIGDGAFYCCSSLSSIPFFPSVQSIGNFAFTLCVNIEDANLASCNSIGIEAFFCCTKLNSVEFGQSSISLGKRAFSQSGLINLSVPQGLTEIPECAFELCSELTAVNFEGSSHVIGTDAFYGCTKLANLSLDGVSQIGIRAFMGCGMNVVRISQSVVEINNGAFADCLSLSDFSGGSSIYTVSNGVLYKGSHLIQFPAGKNIGGFNIPSSVTTIAPYSFYGCEKLVQVGIGNQVTTIGEAAFALCSGLQFVIIGSNVDTIPMATFGECSSLSLIRFTGDAPVALGEDAFFHCSNSLIFEYLSDKNGWTESNWIGPDGNSYTTRSATLDKYCITARANDSKAEVQLFNTTYMEKDVCIVASLQSNGRTVATKSHFCLIPASDYATISVSVGGSYNQLVLHMLDSNTYAPLSKPYIIDGLTGPTASNGVVNISDIISLRSRSAVSEHENMEYYSVDESVAPAENQGHAISRSIEIGVILVSRSAVPTGSGYYEFSETTYDCHIGDINELMHLYMRGEKPTLEEVSHVDEMRRADISVNVGVSRSGEHEWRLGDQEESNPIKFFTATASGTASANIGSFSARDGYTPPNINLSGSFKGTVAQAQLVDKDFKIWLTRDWKLNVDSSIDVTSVEASGAINLDGSGAEVSGSLGADALKMNNKFTLSKGGHDLISISADPGAGTSVSGKAIISAKKIQLKAGTKVGLGGDVSFEIYPEGILNAMFESDIAKDLMGKIQKIRVYNDKSNGDKDLIASGGFMLDSEGNITSFWSLPLFYTSIYPGDSLYKTALPKSTGGTVMPSESVLNPSSGTIHSPVKPNQLTAQQKMQLASKLIGMPVNVLPAAEMIIAMYTAQHVDISNRIDKIDTPRYELNTSLRFDSGTGFQPY